MSDQDIMEQMQRSSSAKRYRPEGTPTNDTQQQVVVRARARRTAEQPLVIRTTNTRKTAEYGEKTTNAPQVAQQQQEPCRRTMQTYQQQRPLPDADTDADVEVAPNVRTRSERPAPPTRQLPLMREHQGPYAQGHTKAITIGVGATIAVMWLAWLFSTTGASFWATHVTDPATYGPMHGNVVTGVFGGGDSTEHPTKLLALNNGGRVEIIKITADDPKKTQIITGPDLVASSFPDPTQAEIELRVDGPDVSVTIYGSAFVLPFHRYSQFVVLHSDGKGNLKPKTGGQ